MSRVAAKKRVKKLEAAGIIRGFHTCICKEGEIILLMDLVTVPGKYESMVRYLATKIDDIRQIYSTTRKNHITV